MLRITEEQINFWDRRIYPIYSRAKKLFRLWIDHSIPKVRTNKIKHYAVSDITFSIQDKQGTNASRFAIGIFNPKIEDYELFNEIARIFTKGRLFIEPRSNIFLLGIGEDIRAREDKFYVYYKNPWNKNITIRGYTFKDGHLVETKLYTPVKRGFQGRGLRGPRLQLNYELDGMKAIHLVERLNLRPETKVLAIKALDSGLFSLDTISYSKTRGTTLYFD